MTRSATHLAMAATAIGLLAMPLAHAQNPASRDCSKPTLAEGGGGGNGGARLAEGGGGGNGGARLAEGGGGGNGGARLAEGGGGGNGGANQFAAAAGRPCP